MRNLFNRISALRHDMLSDDALAGQFAAILNFLQIFPVLSTGGIPASAIQDPAGGYITDPSGGAYITET